MRINHIFIPATDVEQSTRFYCDLFGFTATKRFNDGAGDCQTVHRDFHGHDLDLLITPITTAKLPYAHHLAFETGSAIEFENLLQAAKEKGLKPRSDVPLESAAGTSIFKMNGKTYQHFYVLDPSGVNIEIMFQVQA